MSLASKDHVPVPNQNVTKQACLGTNLIVCCTAPLAAESHFARLILLLDITVAGCINHWKKDRMADPETGI